MAEIDARYAERMRECQEKIKEQIAAVRTMTEFMESMTDGNPNMALITKGSVNENCVRVENEKKDKYGRDETQEVNDGFLLAGAATVIEVNTDGETLILEYQDKLEALELGEEIDREEISRILEGALHSGDITQNEYNNLERLFKIMFSTTNEKRRNYIYREIKKEYERITERNQIGENETNIYFLNDYFYSGKEFSEDEIFRILEGGLLSGNITQKEYDNLDRLFTEMFSTTDETRRNIMYKKIKKEYERITERNQYLQMYINDTSIYSLNDYFYSGEEFDKDEIFRILEGALLSAVITQKEYDNLKELFAEIFELKEIILLYEKLRILKEELLAIDTSQWENDNMKIFFVE